MKPVVSIKRMGTRPTEVKAKKRGASTGTDLATINCAVTVYPQKELAKRMKNDWKNSKQMSKYLMELWGPRYSRTESATK